jgi:hypothetical protein
MADIIQWHVAPEAQERLRMLIPQAAPGPLSRLLSMFTPRDPDYTPVSRHYRAENTGSGASLSL